MSADQKRPLYAFLIVALLCGFFLGHSVRANGLFGTMQAATPGAVLGFNIVASDPPVAIAASVVAEAIERPTSASGGAVAEAVTAWTHVGVRELVDSTHFLPPTASAVAAAATDPAKHADGPGLNGVGKANGHQALPEKSASKGKSQDRSKDKGESRDRSKNTAKSQDRGKSSHAAQLSTGGKYKAARKSAR